MRINAKKRGQFQIGGPGGPLPGRIAPLFLALALCGCAKGAAGGVRQEYGAAASSADWAVADWAGAGFNPEGPAALERAPAFKDMGNLYGEVTRGAAGLTGESPAPEKSRKLIKSARIQTRVENLEEGAARVEALLEQYQAYASNTAVYDNSRSYTLKIPSAHYETALREFGNIGKIIYRSENAEDSTLKYYDLEGRLNTRLELLKTFQAYLGKAETIEDIMTVEKRIAELQQEIDWYGSQLADLSHLIDYATVNLELRGPASETAYYKPPVKDKIAGLFRSFSGVASTALVILLGLIMYGVPALLILTLLFWILFGRVGLIRKIWRLVGTKKNGG